MAAEKAATGVDTILVTTVGAPRLTQKGMVDPVWDVSLVR